METQPLFLFKSNQDFSILKMEEEVAPVKGQVGQSKDSTSPWDALFGNKSFSSVPWGDFSPTEFWFKWGHLTQSFP